MFNIKFREATLPNVVALLEASGYVHGANDFKFAHDNDLFKFLGVSNGNARYLIGFEDEEQEGNMYASLLTVFLSAQEGGFSCDWSGNPQFETTDLAALMTYFETRCN